MSKKFRQYNMDQPILFSTDIREWIPKDHIALFISDIIDSMNLQMILKSYEETRGQPPYDPRLLLKLLVYGYSCGIRSSRRIEKATYEIVPFRVLCADTHPDHDTISEFRKRHIKAFDEIFLEILELCKKAKLLKCAHFSLDGTKIKANAKKSKSRKYDQFMKTRDELQKEIREIIQEAEEVDRIEDEMYGKGKRGDELPDELRDAKKRKAFIEEQLKKMNEEADKKKRDYPQKKKDFEDEDDDWLDRTDQKIERRPPVNPTNKDTGKIITSRRNPTDYDSRIMRDGYSGGYMQGYNCQAVVDADKQIIVATDVSNQPNDKQLAKPMLKKAIENSDNKCPDFFTADNGYFSEREVVALEDMGVDPYIPPTEGAEGKRKINTSQGVRTITGFMRDKLNSKTGRTIYGLRKSTVEPVFGQMKENRNFRSFLLRGLEKVKGEWSLIALAHNIGKLHKV